MTVWERARVLALAPDQGSVAAATELTRTGRWLDAGCDPAPTADPSPVPGSGRVAVWGKFHGSGSTPYETVVEAGPVPAYLCSCPSRKLPCKHALALLLVWSDGQLKPGPPPAYAVEWQQRRAARAQPQPGHAERAQGELVHPEAAAQRAAARASRVASGLDELDRWLQDQLRSGLAGLERAGYGHFDSVAARMVDAQAPGVAGMLRAIPGEIAGEGWPSRVLDQLAALHLLVQAHRQLDRLDDELAATVRSRIGYPIGKDEVLARPGVRDRWVALGIVDTVEYRLETRRVWLYGVDTGRWAMLLSFAPPGGALDATAMAGERLDAQLHFYPGSGQFRALVGERFAVPSEVAFPEPQTLTVAQRRFAELLAADPWAGRMPAVLSVAPVPPGSVGQPWRLRDQHGLGCDVLGLSGDPWLLLACSAGDPIGLFGEWSGRGFRPMSVLPDDRGLDFCSTLVGRAA